ncbi:endoglucanase [bacterium]|nr:endoglucanase [bacterium]
MILRKNFIPVLILLITALLCSCNEQKSNPVQIKESDADGQITADNPNIRYIGRFDRSNAKRVIFDWPGVYIRAKFEGTACSVRLNDGNNLYAVTIDEQPSQVLQTDTSAVYTVASGLADTVHTVLIQKRTEAFVGKGEFLGLVLDEGKDLVQPDAPSDRRIEFIGNSMTCGYGVEGEDANEPFKPETENAALSYAALTGRALDADYVMIAYSGKGMVRNYGDANKTSADPMPALYDRTLCADTAPLWDFSEWIPKAVVINLGTNDFSTQPYPDKQVFQDAYTALIGRVRSNYPGVTIFCVCGPMIGQPCAGYIEQVVDEYRNNNPAADVYYIGISTGLLAYSDRGSDWHPNVQGQQKIADVIVPVIRNAMNW